MPSQSLMAVSSQQSQPSLNKDQSLELVKIFLNASLACICHTRELINWQSECFRTRYIDQVSLNVEDIYHSFCGPESASPGKSQEVRVLIRGGSRRADAILDMVEQGVFNAIEKTYLDVLQIFITTNSGSSKAIQETYTYSFTYLDNAVASVELKEYEQFLSLKDAQRSFKTGIRNLLRSLKDLPVLPEGCSLGMSMSYNNNCPSKYEPAGFVDSKHHKVLPEDWSDLWNKNGEIVSTFDAPHHSINIAARNATYGYQTATQQQDTAVSKQLHALQRTSPNRLPGVLSTLTLPASPQHPAPIARQKSTPNPSRLTRSASRRTRHESEPALEESKSVTAPKTKSGKAISNPLYGLTIQSKNRRKRNIVPGKIAKAIVHAACLDFEADDGETIFDRVQLDRGIIYRIDRSEVVACECGCADATDQMLYCDLCDRWQHSTCYGWSSVRPRSQPDQHMCYSCLLLPEEENKLPAMVEMVHMRLALMYISQLKDCEFNLNLDFCRAIFGQGVSPSSMEVRSVCNNFTKEGLLSESENGLLVITKPSGDVVDRVQTRYLDPMANIEHMYGIAPTKDDIQTSIQQGLETYTQGRDYKLGMGVESKTVLNSLGEEVSWWGYFHGQPGSKRKATIDAQDEPSPRRRKISIAQAFVFLDRSTPLDEDSFRRDAVESIRGDDSLASSTVTDI